jgi:hypothetical protein
MEQIVRFALQNFTLTFLVIGLIASAIALMRTREPLTRPVVVEALFAYFLLFSIGFSCFYNFVMHTFFGDVSAKLIGWADSPFQREVGFANLGFALIGFLAFKRSFDMRLAAVVGPAMFLLGAAGVHIYEMIVAQNFAPHNAGVIFYTDIAIPLIGAVLLWMQARDGRPGRRLAAAPASSA